MKLCIWDAIPILPKRKGIDAYDILLGKHPLPVFESWKEARTFAETVYADPEKLNRLQTECLTWWDAYLERLQSDLSEFIEHGRAEAFKDRIKLRFEHMTPSKLGRFRELAAHQNLDQLKARIQFRVMKYWRRLRGDKSDATWSLDADRSDET